MENRVLLVNPVWGEAKGALTVRAHRRSFSSSRALRYSRNPAGWNSRTNVNRTTMQTQSFLRVSAGQDVLRWKKPLFSLSLSIFFSRHVTSAEYRSHFRIHVLLCSVPSPLFLVFFFVCFSSERARLRRHVSDPPTEVESCDKSSCVERQTATCPAGLVDDVLIVILNLPGLSRYLSDGLVYGLAIPTHYCVASISAHFTKELIPSAQ